jgi:hypothetical protein
MAQTQTDKAQTVPSKSLMTAGPTLHYSHANVRIFTLVVNIFYLLTCVLWSKLFTDSWFSFNFAADSLSNLWQLGQYVLSPISIFEYAWHIAVLGLVMGLLAAVPPLVSQLFSFVYCLPMILFLALFARMPAFALCVLFSCFLIATRPLRFRSRIVSFALCIAPQILYWAIFGGSHSLDPLMWGFSFAPWIFAWLVSLFIAGEVLLASHYTRYRPGMISLFTALTLLLAFSIFQYKIGFDELAYQRYIVKNNPETVPQFHDHSITEAINQTIRNPVTAAYLTKGFYPRDPVVLRSELKKEIVLQLSYGRWPAWLIVPEELDFQSRREYLFRQYENYIQGHFGGRRMPIALYYKALLADFTPDQALLEEKELLRFHNDYPGDASSLVWYNLNAGYPDSPESIEARLRLAIRYAGSNNLEYARQLVKEALDMIPAKLQALAVNKDNRPSYFTAFTSPLSSALTPFKLADLEFRLSEFRELIGDQNLIVGDDASRLRLADFVLINPYARDYRARLGDFMQKLKGGDPLIDNVSLAIARLIKDPHERAARLKAISEQFPASDGGIQALYELGRLKVNLWKDAPEGDAEKKLQFLADSRATLTKFVQLYPASTWAQRARNLLRDLPSIESTEAEIRPSAAPARPK